MDRSGTWKRISRNWGLYLLLLPALVLLILFAYKPMYGVVIAFKNYKNSLGILGSPWVDPLFKNFQRFFNSYQCGTTIRNTLRLTVYSLAVGFPIPIILALMINQITAMRFRRTFQTILYLPHFISTVVMVGLLLIWLSPSSGLVGAFYRLLGKEAPNVMTSASGFPSIYVWSDIWQHAGWDSIVFLAALSSIDPTLYEAATVDGATRWQKMRYIDLPLLMATGEEHGEHEQPHQRLPAPEIPPGQGVGRRNIDRKADEGADHGVQDGVAVAHPDVGLVEQFLVAVQCEAYRHEPDVPARHGRRVGKGSDDDKPQGIQNQNQQQEADQIEHHVKGHVLGLAAHAVPSVGRMERLFPGRRSHPPSLLTTGWFRPASG